MDRLHLADLADGQRTLCGLPVSDARIGGYFEYLDGPDGCQLVRMICDLDGRKAAPCPICLDK